MTPLQRRILEIRGGPGALTCPRFKSIIPLSDLRLAVIFEDLVSGLIDLDMPLRLAPAKFHHLRDDAVFRSVIIRGDIELHWPGLDSAGALDWKHPITMPASAIYEDIANPVGLIKVVFR